MDIAVFGLGYVGAVSAACLSDAGHTVVGVDSNAGKAALINAGREPGGRAGRRRHDRLGGRRRPAARHHRSPEPRSSRANSRSSASARRAAATATSTSPSSDACARTSATRCATRRASPRSSSAARSCRARCATLVIPTARARLRQARRASTSASGFIPEFLRESTAVADFNAPPKIVIAASDDRTRAMLQALNAEHRRAA